MSRRYSGIRVCVAVTILAVCLLLFSGRVYPQTKAASTFSSLSKQAAAAGDANRLDEAVALYNRALALRPGWADGWWSLGTIEYDQNHFPKAALAFKRLLQLQPENGTAHAMLGLCQFELGTDQPALKNLLAADYFGIVKNIELRKVALYHLGVLQLRARRFGDAYESLHNVARDGTRSRELFAALGEAALLISPQDSSVEDGAAANVIERAGEAEALSATREFDQAKSIYVSLTRQFPDYPNLHFAYGRLLLEAHETDEAVEEFHRELNRDPKNVNSMLEIAAVHYRVDSEDGAKYAQEAVKLAPERPFAHYLLGLLRLDTGDAGDAIPELEIAQKAFPSEPKIYFALGSAYSRTGRKADAAKARTEFLRLDRQTRDEPGSDVYGETPSGITEGQLRTENRGNSPR